MKTKLQRLEKVDQNLANALEWAISLGNEDMKTGLLAAIEALGDELGAAEIDQEEGV